ncbi:MAG: DNA ligase D [Flavisolibacter sp.]
MKSRATNVKRAKRTKPSSRISIDLRQERKNFKATIELIKRDFKADTVTTIPTDLSPMLATLTKKPFDDEDWLFEIKWDGYRALAYIQGRDVDLRSRSNLSFNEDYAPIVNALRSWGINAVTDGEITVINEKGKADFEALQNWQRTKLGNLVYYVFDILWLDGINLMKLPLYRRKEILQKLIPHKGPILFSDSIDQFGVDFFRVARENELEGIVAKKKQSVYTPGKRSNDWLKMPTEIRQEFVIGGWAESDSGRPFRSLLFGYYEDGKLINAGHAGGGYKDAQMHQILSRLKKLEIKKSPFANEVETDTKAHWIKPQLVAEIKYASITSSGKIRKPAIFLGFREDKSPQDVRKEVDIPRDEESVLVAKKSGTQKKAQRKSVENSNWPELENQSITSRAVHSFDGREVELTNIEKPLWGGITKAHLLMYYHSVCVYILPHLVDRPLSLHIKHHGPNAPGMYIKDMEGRQPEWAEIFSVKRKHRKKGARDLIDYLVCQNEAALQYIVNLGCIDINPWTSRVQSPEEPDYIVIDLDPSDEDFTKAIEAAKAARKYFDAHKLIAFPKTSGKTGIHIYLPCKGFSFPQARAIAERICKDIHQMVPDITTIEVSIHDRGNKLYLDPNQNDYADTVAAPYSIRPYVRPTVSTPLQWKEINSKLNPSNFTMETILNRLKKKGDLFIGVLDQNNREHNQRILTSFL